MAAAGPLQYGGCLSTDLRRFLASDSKAHGPAGHQLLRKLLSICTGKCELSPQQQQQHRLLPEKEGENVEQAAAAAQRTLRARRYPAQIPQQQQRRRPGRRRPLRQQPQQQQHAKPQQRQRREQHSQQQEEEEEEEEGAHAGDSADHALCSDLLGIVKRESGVVLALALHAMHIWAQASPARMQTCIRHGVVPVLLKVLLAVLSQSPPTPTGAYAASMAVILLRTLSRSGDEGMAAFVGSGGVGALLRALPTLREDRALCLALYLLSDVTRRSGEALGQAVEAEGVALVVACLRRPLGESTKFAVLLINRWCLLAPLGEQFRGAGALDSLLCVLRRQHSAAAAANPAVQPGGAAKALLSEVSAYSLSALAILGQEEPARIRELLVACPSNLAAVTRAMTDYERSFQGTGFPHALLSSLIEGGQGCSLVAQLVRRTELLPAWLSLRQVGWELVERAAQPDVLAALAELPPADQGTVAQALTLLLPHSRAFLGPLTLPDRLAALTTGAVAEHLAAAASATPTTSPRTCTLTPTPPTGTQLPATSSCGSTACQPLPAAAPMPAAAPAQQRPPGAATMVPLAPYTPATSAKASSEETLAPAPSRTESPAMVEGPDSGDAPLQRGASIIPEALQLGDISQQEQQQHAGAPAPAAAADAGGRLSHRGTGCAPAPFTAALRRLLAWAREAAVPAAAGRAPSGSGAVGKRGREAGDGADCAAAAQRAKRARFAFSRQDVNVRRYDTLTFLVGGREFHAVGFVLEANSPLLHSLLGTIGCLHEAIPIPCVAGFDPDRMYRLFGWAVEFCYTGAVEGLTPEGALDLWTLAEFLQIDGLQRECEALLSSPAGGAADVAPQQQGAALLGPRYALGLAYPSGSSLRVEVARQVLARLAALWPPAQSGQLGSVAAGWDVGADVAAGWDVGADVTAVLVSHPHELAADMAQALAGQLEALCYASAACQLAPRG